MLNNQIRERWRTTRRSVIFSRVLTEKRVYNNDEPYTSSFVLINTVAWSRAENSFAYRGPYESVERRSAVNAAKNAFTFQLSTQPTYHLLLFLFFSFFFPFPPRAWMIVTNLLDKKLFLFCRVRPCYLPSLVSFIFRIARYHNDITQLCSSIRLMFLFFLPPVSLLKFFVFHFFSYSTLVRWVTYLWTTYLFIRD